MSLHKKPKLAPVAIRLCRDLRKKSTPAERIFWEAVRNRKIMNKKFNRQFPIYFDLLGKETFYIADFFCFEEKLVIEIDGGYHERQKDYDSLRTEIINSLGIKVIRFKNDEIENNLIFVLQKLKTKLNSPSLEREGAGGMS
jgi:very-short-patch-repair endonuclease